MAKKAGEDALHRVHLDLLFDEQDADQPEPYERLLRDALRGDPQLFPNFDAIDQTWRIVQPLLDDPPPVEAYEPGTWGPSGEPPARGPRRLAQALAAGSATRHSAPLAATRGRPRT